MSKNRIEWIDITKGIGITLMVVGHSAVSTSVKLWIYGFHMPLFFILAGYLYGMVDEIRYRGTLGFFNMVKNKAKAYLKPYVYLFILNLCIEILFEFLVNKGDNLLVTALRYIAAGIYSHDTKMPNCAPIWFLTCLFVSYVYFWLLVTRNKEITINEQI